MLHFYGKSGCKTNRRQRKMLQQAGVEMTEHNLLSTAWTPETLRPFFRGLAVSEWFNTTAPAIKQGELDIQTLTGEQALELMCQQPLLIRRPLLRLQGQAPGQESRQNLEQEASSDQDWLACGFDRAALAARLGTNLISVDDQPDEGCRHSIHPQEQQEPAATCAETEDSL